MISEPVRYLRTFVEAGANSISVHAEVCDDLPEIAAQIHELGARASVAINPETPVERVLAVAEHLDMILVMSVHPGFAGQSFIAESLEKLRAVRREIQRRGLKVDVQVDGGVKIDNIRAAAEAGANVFVSGSGIFGHGDYRKIIAEMRERVSRT